MKWRKNFYCHHSLNNKILFILSKPSKWSSLNSFYDFLCRCFRSLMLHCIIRSFSSSSFYVKSLSFFSFHFMFISVFSNSISFFVGFVIYFLFSSWEFVWHISLFGRAAVKNSVEYRNLYHILCCYYHIEPFFFF